MVKRSENLFPPINLVLFKVNFNLVLIKVPVMLPKPLITPTIIKNNTLTFESNKDFALFSSSQNKSVFTRKRTKSSLSREKQEKNEVFFFNEIIVKLFKDIYEEENGIKHIENILKSQKFHNYKFAEDFQKLKEKMNSIQDSKFPIDFKIKMMESIRFSIIFLVLIY